MSLSKADRASCHVSTGPFRVREKELIKGHQVPGFPLSTCMPCPYERPGRNYKRQFFSFHNKIFSGLLKDNFMENNHFSNEICTPIIQQSLK